jgi:hypothetical protein
MVVVGVLVCITWLSLRQHQESRTKAIVSQPATAAPTSPTASVGVEEPCREAVVLTWQPHSGVSARMTVQNTEGVEIPTESASEDEGKFTTACYRLENDDRSSDASPQFLKVCKPGTFVLK